MSSYDGFSIPCGCRCAKCNGRVRLEGFADANGTHYCPKCDDYVHTTTGTKCAERTPEKTAARQEEISEADVD